MTELDWGILHQGWHVWDRLELYEVICDYYKHVLSIFHHLNRSWGTYPTYTPAPPHGDNSKISPEQWGTSMEDEVTIGDHGVVPLPMGIEREAKCIRAGLWTWKGSTAP